MHKLRKYSLIYLISGSLLFVIFFAGISINNSDPDPPGLKASSYAILPYDTPLDAVKWTGGIWQDRMQRLRDSYLAGVRDGSYLHIDNGSSLRNFLRAAGLEAGGVFGSYPVTWSDGDCFFLFDAVSRLYAYKPDPYLKGKLVYWIPIFSSIQSADGLLDTWTVLNKTGSGKQYNVAHLYKTACTHYRATSDTSLLNIADKYLSYYINSGLSVSHQVAHACGLRYARTGETLYLNKLQSYYSTTKTSSTFGPPFRVAEEIYGHNTQTFHELNGATLLYELTGERALLDALNRLAQNLLSKKTYITGGVASLAVGQRPVITVNSITYPSTEITEGVGQAFDLPLDKAYCESCGQCLYMEFLYRMFRLTSNAAYMDAAERMLYNTTLGCVDLDNPNFFYANPQRQGTGSYRRNSTRDYDHNSQHKFTWKRMYLESAACCRPKVLRAIAMSAEIAYNVSDEGLWVNLYGNNTLHISLPKGDSVLCKQTTDYPWDGKVKLEFSKVKSVEPFSVFLRIPGWVDTLVSIKLNGAPLPEKAAAGTYHRLTIKWETGDRLEMEFPMPVKFMAADQRITEDLGKAAVMRGPIVYCLEDQDIPAGKNIELLYLTGDAKFTPVRTDELGGITKLTGSLVYTSRSFEPFNTSKDFIPDKALYQKMTLADSILIGGGEQTVQVSMIPFCVRLNRASEFFKVWIPVYKDKTSSVNTGLADNDKVVVYPNPSYDELFLAHIAQEDIVSAGIYSTSSMLVQRHSSVAINDGISLSNLTPGVYILELKLKNKTYIRSKFIKN